MTPKPPLQANSAPLPPGHTQRPMTLADADDVARLHQVAAQARSETQTFTAETILARLQNPPCNLETDSQVILNAEGQIVAFLALWDGINPTHPWFEWEVMPGADWQTLARAILTWGEQRALQALERCQPEERFGPALAYNADMLDQVAFVASLGYDKIRYFYRMAITMQEAPTVPPMPEGFTLRTFDNPADLETLVMAREEIWKDHFAYIERPIEQVMMEWGYGIQYDPLFDASLWYLAIDNATGTIAGIVLGRIQAPTNAEQGYVQLVGVRRDYRKQGLAQAMLMRAFAEFWVRGQKTVVLGVDASSPTGATRLYERVGMQPVYKSVFLEKEIRAGVERMNV